VAVLPHRVASGGKGSATLRLMRWRILAVLIVAPCLAAALTFGAARGVNDAPVVGQTGTTGVLWGERVFTSRQQLTTWLNTRGARYTRWQKRHPAAASRLR
jgi:hypothetical protein